MYFHKAHIVDPSPWPILVSLNLLYITLGGVSYMHYYINGSKLLIIGIIGLLLSVSCWFRDVIREGTYNRHHTDLVKKNLRLGMILFIVSEVMFFFSFFWAFFHSSLAPTHYIGCIWPPAGITLINPFEIPLANTVLLLTSGIALTLSHYVLSRIKEPEKYIYMLVEYYPKEYFEEVWQIAKINYSTQMKLFHKIRPFGYIYDLVKIGFVFSIITGIVFLVFQFFEYLWAPFSISDGIYGSLFYLITGFHGIHVIIGIIFIIVQYIRYCLSHFTMKNHFGFEASAWYWHFVDVVWLIVYLTVYVWSFM